MYLILQCTREIKRFPIKIKIFYSEMHRVKWQGFSPSISQGEHTSVHLLPVVLRLYP